MTFSGILVDDNEDESVYAELMSSKGLLNLVYQRPRAVSQHAKEIFNEHPDIVVLDFRLDLDLGDLAPNEAYKGSALAQQLRDLAIENPEGDFPIVLISSEEQIREQYEPDRTSHDLFDFLYSKEHINAERKKVQSQIISLSEGYQTLKQKNGEFSVTNLAGIGEDEGEIAIDYQGLKNPISRAAAPHLVASVFFNQLINRSGPLIDINNACARLGLARSEASRVSDFLQGSDIGYNGLFSTGWVRFWAHRLDALAREMFGARPTGLEAGHRSEAFSKAVGEKFEPAASPWTKKTDELISFACTCCNDGTELRHSVGVFESSLPSFSVQRRVCWRCVHEDRDQHQTPSIILDSSDEALIAEVKKMEIPG